MSTQRVVTFHYTLTNTTGETLDSSRGHEPMSYLEGMGQIIPGLESKMTFLKKGDKTTIQVLAADAYGPKIQELLARVPRAEFPVPTVKVGDRFRTGEAHEHGPVFVVLEVTDKEVVLDGNHPLAGQDLTFDVEITDMRLATAEELSHGHAHGPNGHHH